MEFRDSFSTLKKKVKHRLGGSKPKSNKTEADVSGERVDSTGSRPGSGPHIVAGGSHDQKGAEPNTDGGQAFSTIRLPQLDEPGSMPTHGSANDQERRRADVDGGEVERTHSHLRSVDVEVAEGSGPAERKDIDGEKVDPCPPTASIPHDGKPDSV